MCFGEEEFDLSQENQSVVNRIVGKIVSMRKSVDDMRAGKCKFSMEKVQKERDAYQVKLNDIEANLENYDKGRASEFMDAYGEIVRILNEFLQKQNCIEPDSQNNESSSR